MEYSNFILIFLSFNPFAEANNCCKKLKNKIQQSMRLGFIYMTITILAFTLAAYKYFNRPQIEVKIKNDTYYGPRDHIMYTDNMQIKPFTIAVEPRVITDLQQKLWKHINKKKQDDMFDQMDVQSFVSYWRGPYLYNWENRLKYLNRFKQFQTEINGLNVHFIHEKSLERNPQIENNYHVPLLLLHGWPVSVREFYELIPRLLAYSENNFIKLHIVVPSLIGHGFSSTQTKPGFGTYEMAIVLRNLMLRLGYNRFMVHGGIWGSIIGDQIATIFPENVMAFHSNLCFIKDSVTRVKAIVNSILPNSYFNRTYICTHFSCAGEAIYAYSEGTEDVFLKFFKVKTVGRALTKDPVLLAQYILQKMAIGGNYLKAMFKNTRNRAEIDGILDNIMIYYLTNTVLSGIQYNVESISEKQVKLPYLNQENHVPTGCMQLRNKLQLAEEGQLRAKFLRLVHMTFARRDVYFPAMETPADLFRDMVMFARKIFFDRPV